MFRWPQRLLFAGPAAYDTCAGDSKKRITHTPPLQRKGVRGAEGTTSIIGNRFRLSPATKSPSPSPQASIASASVSRKSFRLPSSKAPLTIASRRRAAASSEDQLNFARSPGRMCLAARNRKSHHDRIRIAVGVYCYTNSREESYSKSE